jgi:hypothetical protein
METSELFWIIILVGLPATAFVTFLFILRSKRFLQGSNAHYQITIFKSIIILTKQNFIRIVYLILLFCYLDFFFPLPFSILIVLSFLIPLYVLRSKKIETKDIEEATNNVLDRLATMEKDFAKIKQHFDLLREEILFKQSEINEKESYNSQLLEEISHNQKEVETWESMNDEQKRLLTDRTAKAFSKSSKWDFWLGISLGFIFNILATLTWTLLGNPGKTELIEKLNDLLKLFS